MYCCQINTKMGVKPSGNIFPSLLLNFENFTWSLYSFLSILSNRIRSAMLVLIMKWDDLHGVPKNSLHIIMPHPNKSSWKVSFSFFCTKFYLIPSFGKLDTKAFRKSNWIIKHLIKNASWYVRLCYQLGKKAAWNAQTITIFMNINISDDFSLIVLLKCLNPFARQGFLQTFLTKSTPLKKKIKLINDYEWTDYEYEVKLGHVKAICSMYICKYLSQSHHCHW